MQVVSVMVNAATQAGPRGTSLSRIQTQVISLYRNSMQSEVGVWLLLPWSRVGGAARMPEAEAMHQAVGLVARIVAKPEVS